MVVEVEREESASLSPRSITECEWFSVEGSFSPVSRLSQLDIVKANQLVSSPPERRKLSV